MVRLNLQLFATLNTKTSIVDYLKSQGKDSSMSARKELAKQYGISNYSGTYEQNVTLLNKLKSGSSGSSSSSTKTTNTATTNKTNNTATTNNTNTSKYSSLNGVDQSVTNTINSTFSASDKANNAQAEADSYLEKVKEMASVEDIISQETWDAINKQWNGGSSAYQEAWAYTNGLLEQLSTGRTSYTDQIKEMMDKIQNREDFQYDISTDTMFQNSLASAMVSGQSAMQDTIGQASALTGGYASTYATSAGNQAYNAYIQDAYNNLPEYYNMALEAYQMEGNEMYNQLAMLNEADTKEYGRLYDAWQANFTNTQNMYNQEYGAWQDSVNNAIGSANLQLNEYGQLFDQTYSAYNATQTNASNIYAQEYQKWADEVNTALKYATMQNSDYWSNQNFIEDQRQHNETIAEQRRQHNDDMTYKNNALAQDNAQFIAMNDYNGDGVVDVKDTEYKAKLDSKSSAKTPSETQYSKALSLYNSAVNSGDSSAYNAYLASLEANGVDIDQVLEYIADYGNEKKESIFDKWFK